MTKLLSSLSWTLSRKKEKFLVSNFVRFQKQIRDQLAQQKRDDDGFDHTQSRVAPLSLLRVFVFLIRRYVSFEKGARVKNWERKNASALCDQKESPRRENLELG